MDEDDFVYGPDPDIITVTKEIVNNPQLDFFDQADSFRFLFVFFLVSRILWKIAIINWTWVHMNAHSSSNMMEVMRYVTLWYSSRVTWIHFISREQQYPCNAYSLDFHFYIVLYLNRYVVREFRQMFSKTKLLNYLMRNWIRPSRSGSQWIRRRTNRRAVLPSHF